MPLIVYLYFSFGNGESSSPVIGEPGRIRESSLLPAADGLLTKGALARQTQGHKHQTLPAIHTSSAPIAFRIKAMLAVKD